MSITVEWLHARCFADGEHLIWKGYCSNRGTTPQASYQRKRLSVRREAWKLAHDGRAPRNNCFVVPCCGNDMCVNPGCMVEKPRKLAQKGYVRTPAHNAKIAEGKRKNSHLTQEDARDIRSSNESTRAVARRYGISQKAAHLIRTGRMRRDYVASPFDGLGARNA